MSAPVPGYGALTAAVRVAGAGFGSAGDHRAVLRASVFGHQVIVGGRPRPPDAPNPLPNCRSGYMSAAPGRLDTCRF